MTGFRIGQGYDIHRIVPDRAMVLGGITFDVPFGLEGHTDADALTHAICDALLGAAGLPDIGHRFPNTDPEFAGIDSQLLLQRVAKDLRYRGWSIGNIDASLVAEKPKIAPRLTDMKATLSSSTGITVEQLGLKATTNEGAGSLGRGEAIAAHAVALIFRTSSPQ